MASAVEASSYTLAEAVRTLELLSSGAACDRRDTLRAAITLAIFAPASAHLVTEDEMFAVVHDLEHLVLTGERTAPRAAIERIDDIITALRSGTDLGMH
jgi:hypothetical protein